MVSSQAQLNNDFDRIYQSMTDPDAIAERQQKEKRKQTLSDLQSDYGLT